MSLSDVMIIKENDNNQFRLINDCFKNNFSNIKQDVSSCLIMRCMSQFKRELLDNDFISYEIEEDEITHGDKIQLNLNHYFQYPKNLAQFVSSQFGTVHAFVCNRESFDGIIFLGQQNNLYATCLVFEFLEKIASSRYNTYLNKLKRYKKQETKDDKARDYMDDWLEDLKYHAYETRFFDRSDKELFAPYAKQHFKTTGDERKALQNMVKLMEPVINEMKEESVSVGELRDRLYSRYPEDEVINVMKEVNNFNDKDLILSFRDNCYFDDDDELYWDEEE